ncbi:MAG: ABC transporter substrate-binding protein, partial [Nevskiales bacterium]
YWKQPGVPGVADFVAAIHKKTNKVPTARTWFGYAALWTCALVANEAKTLDAVKLAHALQGFALPPEIALMPGKCFYRAEDHQFMPAQYVGRAQAKGSGEYASEDLFVVDTVLQGSQTAPPASETGCKLEWPA